jgi:hypothetical protein
VLVVLGDVLLPLVRRLLLRKDRLHRAGVDAEAAVDALLGMDVELLPVLVLAVDAIDRAHIHARDVLHPDAGLGDDVGHALESCATSASPWAVDRNSVS